MRKHLKTNSRELKRKLQKYILDCIEIEDAKEDITEKEKLQYVYKDFLSWLKFQPNKIPSINNFAEWLKTLPTTLTVDFFNSEIITHAKAMGSYKDVSGMTQREIENYESRIVENWFSLIARNFFEMLEKSAK